ncbi:NAD(P)-dependent oxidoreductase [Mycolicibacterium peregrinum]|uniref:NAD(P)-dependent oxidoreductase n=1 Tax=Mycolicibacterium peregrinum TaxID=43304 RepID=A0A4Z0HW37_MYCPR|nr:NAD(P)-dependent oxidoreductase [Mycolicibacterium peregrinum]TGB43093.1 NAD(P)-dependent oxidoreductase [Mycolicibacterium peregrinum]TGB44136.1 NAD(P)-dependent oxidoreductase [Mycolicibacterium peregrinum]
MRLGFIGLGHMGFPMASRLIQAGHDVTVFDMRAEAVAAAVKLGARSAASARRVADATDTVLASLPSLQASLDVTTGIDGIMHGGQVQRFVDLSTVGSDVSRTIHHALQARGISALDSPVSGGVSGAKNGTLALMVSGARADFEALTDVFEILGRPVFVGETPGSAQTMKLVNNLMAAATLAATSEVVVMGVKAGLDPRVMIDVLNAGSGATHASRDKFPRAVLPRTFDFGFATGLMVKDVRLYLEEVTRLGVGSAIATAVAEQWEAALRQEGPESDFTSVIKPIETAAGVIVDGRDRR